MTNDEFELMIGALEHVMVGVIESGEHCQVELRRDMHSGALKVVAYNEGGNNCTSIDLWSLLDWLQLGPPDGRVDGGFCFPRRG